jgi:hypothetical protein
MTPSDQIGRSHFDRRLGVEKMIKLLIEVGGKAVNVAGLLTERCGPECIGKRIERLLNRLNGIPGRGIDVA